MYPRMRHLDWLCLATLISLAGCQDDGKSSGTAASEKSENWSRTQVAETPENAVKGWVDDLKAGKPIALWNMMPKEQQDNVDKAVRENFAAVDSKLWDQTRRVLKKLVALLETKKDYILESPLLIAGTGIRVEDAKAHWTPAVSLLKSIVDSDAADLNVWKRFDGRAFLEGTGRKLFGQARDMCKQLKDDPFKGLDGLQATVKEEPSGPIVATIEMPGSKPLHVRLQPSFGRWMVVESVAYSATIMRGAKSIGPNFLPYRVMEWRPGYTRLLKQGEEAIDQLQAAKSSADFQIVVGQKVAPLLVGAVAWRRERDKPVTMVQRISRNREKGTAMVVVKGKRLAADPAIATLMQTLRNLSDEPARGKVVGPLGLEGVTVLLVQPIADVNAFVKKIKVGKVTDVDVARQIVKMELAEATEPAPAAKEKPESSSAGTPENEKSKAAAASTQEKGKLNAASAAGKAQGR